MFRDNLESSPTNMEKNMGILKTKSATIQIHDIYSAAYAAYKGVEPKLVKHDRHVVFLLPDKPHTYHILSEFNGNPKLPLLEYLSHLRKLRAQMIT